MARLPYVDPATASEDVRDVLNRMPVQLAIFRMMAHAETTFRSMVRFGGHILGKQQLSPKLRELAILRVANRSNARYEWVQHVPIAKAAGASDAQVAALERGDANASCFDGREQLVLRFTDELIDKVKVSDATFAAVSKELPPREIVELIVAVGFYMMIARLLETTGVELEADAGTKIVDALKS
ncbi:MAG TPA: carboxymuconolactone decarboxylase family protein [Candidatus Kryptonia bacterium]|nr:carboxymuconolactone decarboxylase family protein [Candidatus Kryptonia bacterium]